MGKVNHLQLNAVIWKDSTGAYCAEVPSLRGCHSCGDTFDEACANIREAAELWLECEAELSDSVPDNVSCEKVAL